MLTLCRSSGERSAHPTADLRLVIHHQVSAFVHRASPDLADGKEMEKVDSAPGEGGMFAGHNGGGEKCDERHPVLRVFDIERADRLEEEKIETQHRKD